MLVLGSQSPRRQEILRFFSIPFEIAHPPFDESSVPYQNDAEAYALSIARGKSLSLRSQFPTRPILTADTVVSCEGKVYGKPRNQEEAFQFLKELSGKWHTVYTAIALVRATEEYERAEATRVLFNSLSDEQAMQFLEAIQWKDKAGAYTIQQAGSLVINRIEGCYFNVVGLPVNTVHALLQLMGINLWDHLSSKSSSSAC